MTTRANIIWCKTVDSTNKEARRMYDAGLLTDNLSIVMAETQTAGQGQGDHVWLSEPGKNLTVSFVINLKDGLKATGLQCINDWICPAICGFLAKEGVDAWVKPPNDIWVGDRKICGILIENIIRGGNITTVIAGVGLNLNQTEFPAELPNPVSLKNLTGKEYKAEDALMEITENLELRLQKWL